MNLKLWQFICIVLLLLHAESFTNLKYRQKFGEKALVLADAALLAVHFTCTCISGNNDNFRGRIFQ